MNWIEYFLNIAENVKLKSKDESTQIGAVIVGTDNEVLSTGYNSFPRGIDDNVKERQERPEKYFWVVHAELNAILNAARVGTKLKGSTIYLTSGLPCSNCARAIINAGVEKVYCKRVCTTKNKDKWDKEQDVTRVMFEETNIKVEYY